MLQNQGCFFGNLALQCGPLPVITSYKWSEVTPINGLINKWVYNWGEKTLLTEVKTPFITGIGAHLVAQLPNNSFSPTHIFLQRPNERTACVFCFSHDDRMDAWKTKTQKAARPEISHYIPNV